ncbi:MAG: neutral zinc metallopeptidase [Planctomycetes bacterium]|nr:neutral zinc metallopeptidase [Planctomycetota bacterium]
MDWQGRRESSNVEDRRSFGGRGVALGGGATVLAVIVCLALGIDPRVVLQSGSSAPVSYSQPAQNPQAQEQLKHFVSVVLADTEDVWHEQFRKMGRTYPEPRLLLFTGRVQSACGMATDAYVIAHEVGHHVQKQLGYSQRVHSQKGSVSQTEYNHLSVRLELQADFLAGVWAHHAQKSKHVLQPGDLDEALRAANAIGDDRLQRQSKGYVVPDSFTHGTSSQRARWFRLGFETGNAALMEELFKRPYSDL